MIEIRFLGDFVVKQDGELITTLNKPRLQSLLAYLILHRDTPQFRYHLAACTPKATLAHNLSFNINGGGRKLVTLVRPKGNGPSAGIICKHWLEPVPIDRLDYLNQPLTLPSHAEASFLSQVYFLLKRSISSGFQNENTWMIGKDQDTQDVRISVDPSSPVSETIEACWYRFQWDPQRHPGGAESQPGLRTYCGNPETCKLDLVLGQPFQPPMV